MRFDFFEPYHKIKLGDITREVKRKTQNSNAPVRMISYGNGFIMQSEKYSRDNAGSSLKNYTLLFRGEFAYNHGASKNKPYGVCYLLQECDEARIPFVYHSFSLTTGYPLYWHYALNTNRVDKQLKKLVSSGVRMDGLLNISYESYMSINIYEPTFDEQLKIAKFLTLVDKRIETQNKIIKEYETLKNWIISYEINNVIAEEVRLDSISDIYQPQTISQAELDVCGLYNVYGANGVIGKYNKFNHEKPQICLTCRGSTCGKLLMSEPKSWITGNAMVINTDKYSQVNKKYLFVFLTTINFSNIISGSGQPQIVRAPLAKIKVKLPLITIQKRIEHNISILEEKLQKEKDILNAYKKQKAYLLQNMFI